MYHCLVLFLQSSSAYNVEQVAQNWPAGGTRDVVERVPAWRSSSRSSSRSIHLLAGVQHTHRGCGLTVLESYRLLILQQLQNLRSPLYLSSHGSLTL